MGGAHARPPPRPPRSPRAFGFARLDAPPTRADGSSERAVRYLIASQNADGSFLGERGGYVSETITGEVALGSPRPVTTRST